MIDLSDLNKDDLRLLREACRVMAWHRWGAQEKRHSQSERYIQLMRMIDEELGENIDYWENIDEMKEEVTRKRKSVFLQ